MNSNTDRNNDPKISSDLLRTYGHLVTLVVARLRTRMKPDFDVAGLTDEIGREHFYPSVKLAVDAFARRSGVA